MTQAARRAKVNTKLAKKLKQLDVVAAWIRHATQPRCEVFMRRLATELAGELKMKDVEEDVGEAIREADVQGDGQMNHEEAEHGGRRGLRYSC